MTFGAPVAMPADGGHSAFGVRLAPLPGGQAAVSWTETTATGDQAVLVSVLGADGRPRQPEPVLTGDGPPLVLPGASFYDFPAGDIAALPDGKLMVAAPFWVSGRSVIKLAAGTPGGPWQQTSLNPPAGADLLLPALGLLSPGDVRLLCAVHTRSGDRLGYDWAGITLTSHGPAVSLAGLRELTPGTAWSRLLRDRRGTGARPHARRTADRGRSRRPGRGRTRDRHVQRAPRGRRPPNNTGTPASRTPSPGTPGTSGRTAPGAGTARAANARPRGFATTAAWLAAAALACAGAAGALLLRRRRGSARHHRPSHRRR